MSPIHLPAGMEFVRIDREWGKRGKLYVFQFKDAVPWLGQSVCGVCTTLSELGGTPVYSSGFYRCLRCDLDGAKGIRLRVLALSDLGAVNALIAGGCVVCSTQPELWQVKHGADPPPGGPSVHEDPKGDSEAGAPLCP
jgi:hypothetical protein